MTTNVLEQSTFALTLSGGERESLLRLLRQTLGEVCVEVHRTHTPAFREVVLGEQAVIRALIEKLERACPEETEVSPTTPGGIEEGSPMPDVIFIDDQGQFQMAMEDLEDFIRFLGENKVRVEAETANVFHSGGKAHGYGRLLHLFDTDSASRLYRTWKQARASGTAGEMA